MKTYSAKTNALAAEAVLTAAVDEAVALLRAEPLDRRPDQAGLFGWQGRVEIVYRYRNDSLVRAKATLLAAAQSAELLLDRAALLDEGRAS